MGDMGEVFREMTKQRKERHQKWHETNMKILNESGLKYRQSSDTCILFRDKDKPKVDFFPHTGRWRSKNKTYSGGAKSFVNWYKKQRGK